MSGYSLIPGPETASQQFSAPSPQLASLRKTRYLLAARHLSTLSVDNVVENFQHNPVATAGTIESLLTRLGSSPKFDDVAQALLQTIDTTSQRAAILLAKSGHIGTQIGAQIDHQALSIVEEGQLPITERQETAHILSRSGDPRDLATLATVPAGIVTLGSNTHIDFQPTQELSVDTFHVGIYPVAVQQYTTFSNTTDRQWVSPNAHEPDKRNFPATDVTWHDAVA